MPAYKDFTTIRHQIDYDREYASWQVSLLVKCMTKLA